MRKISLLLLLFLSTASLANYEFSVSIRDGAHLTNFVSKNQWMQKFLETPLYRGMFFRLNPVFHFIDKNEVNWKGKLANFFASKVLNGKTVDLFYYHERKTVTQIGMRVRNISDLQESAIQTLIAAFSGDSIYKEGIKINAVNLLGNKLAIILHEKDLIISRSPVIAQKIVAVTKNKIASDLDVNVDISVLSPSIFPFVNKFYGLDKLATLAFSWDKKNNRFIPATSTMQCKSDVLKNKKVNVANYSYLPAAAPLSISLFTPVPTKWNQEKLSQFLKLDKKQLQSGNYDTVSFVHLGVNSETSWSMSTLILPVGVVSEQELVEFDKLFDSKVLGEASFESVCTNMLSVSNSFDSVKKIKSLCEQKEPSFSNLGNDVAKFFNKGESFAFGQIRLSQFLKQVFITEWKLATDLPEYTSTISILEGIPDYFFKTSISNNQITLQGKFK